MNDAKEADKRAYYIVMSAVTSATEALPTGLALFNKKGIIIASAPTNPRETLKKH
jgi:hypothetical protein